MRTIRLAQLIAAIEARHVAGPSDAAVTEIRFDSRAVQPGDLFIARLGLIVDGHDYITDAVSRGAAAIVCERLPAGCWTRDAAVYQTNDSRIAEGLIAARFYEDPARYLTLIALTGTNGKTTGTYLVEAIAAAAGRKPGVIGTVSYRYLDRVLPAAHTTPEPVTLHRLFREMLDDSVDTVAMEVSSIALDQKRVAGLRFQVAAFTNLTRDHLDYHKNFETYFHCKKLLFDHHLAAGGKAVINRDDPHGLNLIAALDDRVLTTSSSPQASADVRPMKVEFALDGIKANVKIPGGTLDIESPLVGRFNLANLMTAVGCGVALKFPHDAIVAGLRAAHGAPGRMERVANARDVVCLVDYAHTPDALERVLAELDGVKARRVITVFGCGGDRDKGKRPQMGQIAAEVSDVSIVTSDNPRTEEPRAIIDDILPGVRSTGARLVEGAQLSATADADHVYVVEPDRRTAIRLAISIARPRDIVLIAGKGHEDYQEVNKVRHPFVDRVEAERAFQALDGGEHA